MSVNEIDAETRKGRVIELNLAEDRRAEDLCDKPTPEWYREILAEDMQNQRDLEQIEEILSENKVDLSKYPVWEKGIKALRMNAELYAASKKAYFAVRLRQNMPEAMPKEKASACIDEFDEVVKRLEPLPEYARCRKYKSGSTLPKAVGSLRKELTETPHELSLSNVPTAVRKTIRREFGDTLVDIKTKTRDGRLVFEVDGRIDCSDAEINVFEDGTIRNRR